MRSMRNRLRRLETGGDERCSECGGPRPPRDPLGDEVEYLEYVIDWGDGEVPEPLPPCPECGRERETVVDWDDAPNTPEELAELEAKREAELLDRRGWSLDSLGKKGPKEESAAPKEALGRVPDYPPRSWGSPERS